MNSIVIVGHGPSMEGCKLGKVIDSHDIVIRLKAGILSEDFGYKTTVMCASTEVVGLFFNLDAQEYWAYPKKGYFDRAVFKAIVQLQKPVMIPLAYCNEWNKKFRDMKASHPNVSTGMAAILIALHRYNPKEISLAGFDTLLNPETEFNRHKDVPSTGLWKAGLAKTQGHDWKKENELLTNLPVRVICLR